MGNQEKEAKAAPQSQQEQELKLKYENCVKDLEKAKAVIDNMMKDVSSAMDNRDLLVALLKEKQRREDELRVLVKECDSIKVPDPVTVPDLTKNQIILATSSTKRKIAALLVRNVPCNAKLV